MESNINRILKIQQNAWRNGHENYGSIIDIEGALLKVLKGFKHLNPKQKDLLGKLENNINIKYAKPLASKAKKAVRHYIVGLK